MGRIVTLPSGAQLTVNVAPFKDAKFLFQAIANEWKTVKVGDVASPAGMMSLFTAAFSSPEVEKTLWPCMIRSLYGDTKITPEVFEPEDSRQDFIPACMEVVKDNISPFTKALF
jgi:hypothetical protein